MWERGWVGEGRTTGRTGITVNMVNVIIIQQIIYGLQLHTQTWDKEMTK